MNTRLRLVILPVLVLVLAGIAVFNPQGASTVRSAGPANKVLARALNFELGRAHKPKYVQNVSGGVMYTLLLATGELDRRARSTHPSPVQGPILPATVGTEGCSNTFNGGGMANVRVNQDCSFRRQAEEVIVVNPTDSKNLVAGQNDSRLGFNHCGYDWSLDGGKTWGDMIPPFYQFLNADGTVYDACSDPTATFDSTGNAFVGGVVFEISLADSGFLVMESKAGYKGSFYHNPGVGIPFQQYGDSSPGVVANDNDPNIFNDKEFIVADSGLGSPKADNVYATWTRFNANTGVGVGANSPIYFSQSTDAGMTWSAGVEISGANAAYCTAFSGESNPNACDQDQGSDPIVGADGTIYVAFGNGNVPANAQHMIVSCPASADCSVGTNWTAPIKISDDFNTQPVGPDPNTACSSGRQCLPPNGYRMDDYVEGSLSVDSKNRLYFAWGDYRNANSTTSPFCLPGSNAAGDTPPCDNDVFYSFSTDHGATWSSAANITPSSKFGNSAQWQPWSAVGPGGLVLNVAFYDRRYGNCEMTGCNDITLARIDNPAGGSPNVTYQRITTSSMPNLLPSNNPFQAGFLGDYMWVTVDPHNGQPFVVWADTRGQNGSVEEDLYAAKP